MTERNSHQYPNEDHPLIRKPHLHEKGKNYSVLLIFSVFVLLPLVVRRDQIHPEKDAPIFESSSFTASIEHINNYIYPGRIFYDIEGDPINAHGGGFLQYNNTYYWYGEIKQVDTYLPKANADWGGTRVDSVGISCYASTDLLNWRKCDTYNVLPAFNDNPLHDLHWSKVAERPKVVYNAKTQKFVMWLHVDTMDYQAARCGVAISSSPEGQFTYLGSFRPEGQMARDLTVFVDDDSKAYLFTSSEDNAVMHVCQLTDDYLNTSGTFERVFIGKYVEAPTLFKRHGKYIFIGSGCTAWNPNAAKSAVANSIFGPWKMTGNPCTGKGADKTFQSQSTFVIPVSSEDNDTYIFAADRWNMSNLSDSRYVWLPISFRYNNEFDAMYIRWEDQWRPNVRG